MKYALLLSLGLLHFTVLAQSSIEICGNGIDDDGNGLTDCDDTFAGCEFFQPCSAETNCNNGIDDDGDGIIDYYDSDCQNDPNNPNAYITSTWCTSSPANVGFEADVAWDSNIQTSAALGMPSVADLDQDGYPEIISMNSETGWLYILDGRTGNTLKQVRVKNGQVYPYPTIGDVDGDGFGEIFTIDLVGVIKAYEHDLTLKWSDSSTFQGYGRNLGLADFNQDGKAELYSVNEIRDAKTGAILIRASHGGIQSPSGTNWHTELNAIPVAIDILPSPGLELVLGHIIYEVNISNTSYTSGNSLTVAKNMNTSTSKPADYAGYYPADADFPNQTYSTTSVVDFNQDGELDVLMGGANGGIDGPTTAFFWDVSNDQVKMYTVTRPANIIPINAPYDLRAQYRDMSGNACDAGETCYWPRGMGNISIADMDGDGQLEATFVSGSSLYALKSDFTEKWANHQDFWETSSGGTGVATYDFDGDGTTEILYRDEIDLYIIDGNTGLPLNNQISGTFCSSQTQVEYPIIADVDGDGETEIILSCGQAQNIWGQNPATSGTRTDGFIRAYKAAQGTTWTPARKVWNQYTYFNTNINDDLSVPRYQQAHHQNLNSHCSSILPLNKFLSQSSLITPCGDLVFPAAKLDFVSEGMVIAPPVCPDNQFEVKVVFQNNGNQAISKPIPISFYADNPVNSYSNTDESPYLETININIPGGLQPEQLLDTTITVNAIRGEFELFASLNDIGQYNEYGSPVANEDFYPLTKLNGTIRECDDTPTIISKAVNPLPFTIKAVKIRDNRNCPGDVSFNNGEIEVVTPDDTPLPASSYAFTWTNISTGQVVGTNALLTGLDAGTYRILVENTVYGCSSIADTLTVLRFEEWPDTQVITLEELQPVSSCAPGTADGVARVLINGAVVDESEYDIIWEDEQQPGVLAIGDTATNLKSIRYKVTFMNKLTGCPEIKTIDMTLPQPEMGQPAITSNTNCKNPNGSITPKLLSGSVLDYDFMLIQLSPLQDTIYSTNPSFSGLAAGLYEIRAYDPTTECGRYSNGVEVELTDQITIDELSLEVVKPQTACATPHNGQLRAVIANPSDYSFAWYRGTVTGTSGVIVGNAATTPDTLGTSLTDIYTLVATKLSSGCSISQQIQLTENITTADFSYSSSVYCQSGMNPTPNVNTYGGIFSATPAGLVLDATSGKIDLSASVPGNYSITYTLASNGSCPSENQSFELIITTTDDASFSYAQSTYCQNEVNPVPVITGNAGGSFSSSPGLVLDVNTGEIDLSASTPGTYTVTYTTSGACPASSSFDLTINPTPAITSTDAYFIKCDGFTVHWNDRNYNIEGYSVQVAEDPEFARLVLDSLTTVEQDIEVAGLNAGGTYYFRVGIVSDCGIRYSETNSVMLIGIPAIHPAAYISQVSKTSFTLRWDSVQYAENYYIELDDNNQFSNIDHAFTTWGGEVTFSSLSASTHYYVRLKAINQCGTGPNTIIQVTTAVDPLVSDSLALVALYHATDGDHWNRNDNWLTGPIDSWYGITFYNQGQQIGAIDLSSNNLKGYLPEEFVNLEIGKGFNLQNNKIDSISSRGFVHQYYDIRNNILTFSHIIPSVKLRENVISPIYYSSQALISKDTTLYFNEGESYTINLGIDESIIDNQYVWFKDDVAFDTTNVNYYTLSSLTLADEGKYICEVTNAGAPALTLYSHPITIHVSPKNEKPTLSVSASKNCIDEEMGFTANGRNQYETYRWFIRRDTGYSIILSDSVTTSPTLVYSLDQEGDYTVRLTLSNPYLDDTVLVDHFSIKPSPKVSLLASMNLNADSLMLTALDAYNADSLTFEWYKSGAQDKISLGHQNTLWVKEAGTYGVTVTNPTGCQVYAETLVIDTRPQIQSITFDTIPDKVYGESLELQATASSGLPITYEVIEGQEFISLSDYTVSILGVGIVRIHATQKGNNQYLAAEPVTQSFRIAKAPQQIHFAEILDRMLEEGGFTLDASSSVDLPLTFTFSGPMSLVNQTITLLDTGEVTITAAQQGNSYYLPAEAVSHTFHITQEMEKDTIHRLSIRIDTEMRNVFPLTLSLYQEQHGTYKRIHMESMLSDPLTFETLPEGNYTLKIKPEQGAYLPTYIGQHLLLSESEKISLTQDTDVSLHPISIPEALEEIGITLRGVFIQSNQASNGKLMITKEAVEGTPVVGLIIYLVDTETQSLVATTTTDGDGKFVFANVPSGSYSIKADHKSLPIDGSSAFTVSDQPLDIVVMAGEKISVISVEEGEEEVTAIEDEIIRQQLKFYPNPVEDKLSLLVPSALLGSQLKIFDTNGRLVFTSTISDVKVNCSLAHLSSGHYHLQISQQGKTYSLKILKK